MVDYIQVFDDGRCRSGCLGNRIAQRSTGCVYRVPAFDYGHGFDVDVRRESIHGKNI